MRTIQVIVIQVSSALGTDDVVVSFNRLTYRVYEVCEQIIDVLRLAKRVHGVRDADDITDALDNLFAVVGLVPQFPQPYCNLFAASHRYHLVIQGYLRG